MNNIQHEKIKELVARRQSARMGGGQKRIDAQHAKGKLTATAAAKASLRNAAAKNRAGQYRAANCTDF